MSEINIKKEMLDAVHKNLNVPGLVNQIIEKVADPALRAAVAKSETKLDDILVAAIAPELEKQLKVLIAEKWESIFLPGTNEGDPVGEPV